MSELEQILEAELRFHNATPNSEEERILNRKAMEIAKCDSHLMISTKKEIVTLVHGKDEYTLSSALSKIILAKDFLIAIDWIIDHPNQCFLPLKTPKYRIAILGRRWRDLNGNTYHTVEVSIDSGERHWKSPRTYGYGNEYFNTAMNWLLVEGVVPKSARHSLVSWCHERNIQFTDEVLNVKRRKDL